ncbi:class D sortase [Lentibacillus salicampi]|uniref:Class D sortase n=1 Tax=Lentibacillus salicampi TaxID=175306 RepID=A0A4Y9AFR0_9BACI|nr:class D sortase [Lentibacillus salicampi]TFJ94265.1 class D sortase [Lentibacillus salicampi]
MKKTGVVLIITGIIMVGWFGWQYWSGMQSVERIDDNVVKASENEDHKETLSVGTEPDNIERTGNSGELVNTDYDDGKDIAKLIIPEIDLAFDVFWGTGDEALAKGVGMYDSKWTAPPDQGRHTVLSGHRDSVFRPVGDLEDGDALYVNYNGVDYEYQINKTWITDANDRSVIVGKDEPTLTLSTCYPFHFVGSAPDRYIVEAELVKKGDLLNLD